MDEDDILYQMAKFDLSKPITVTITFENTDDEVSCDEALQEDMENVHIIHDQDWLNIQKNSEQIIIKYNTTLPNKDVPEKINAVVGDQTPITKKDLNIANDNTLTTRHVNSTEAVLDQSEPAKNLNSLTNSSYESISKNSIKSSEIYQHLTDGDELSTQLQDMLSGVSERLVQIVETCYHDSTTLNRNQNKLLTDLKNNYYELSYSTVVTIMLPREKNQIFIKKFLDRTVAHANKRLNWKCERKHVEPFYNELIVWSKRRRDRENATKLQRASKNKKTQNRINYRKNNNRKNNSRKYINRKTNNRINGKRRNKRITNNKNNNRYHLNDTCINKIVNGIDGIKLIDQRTNSNSVIQDKINKITGFSYKRMNDNNVHYSSINDEGTNKQIIKDNNLNNNRLIDVTDKKTISDNNGNRKNDTMNDVDNKLINEKSNDNRINDTRQNNNRINENRMLAERLIEPPLPFNFSHSIIAPIQSLNLNSANSRCIFSGGLPGREISINISSDLFRDHTKKQSQHQIQQSVINKMQNKGSHEMHPNYDNHLQQPNIQQQSTKYVTYEPEPSRPPRPPRPPPLSYINTDTAQTYSYNLEEISNNPQMIQNQSLRNKNVPLSPELWNLRQMCNRLIGKQTTTPVTTSGASINHESTTARRTTGPCNFCGKPTVAMCSKCKKISYCSYICKDLHADLVARCRNRIS